MFATSFTFDHPHRTRLVGCPAGHDARVLADLALRAGSTRPIIHVALDDMRAALLVDLLSFFSPHIELHMFPAWDCLPYDRVSPHPDIAAQRIATLTRLMLPLKKPCIILTTVAAFMQKVLPPEVLSEHALTLSSGDQMPIEHLTRFLSCAGYHQAGTVREIGEMAVRGGIVDFFPAGYERPVRLDFFGDEVEAIRAFDPLTQTTIEKLDTLTLRPTSEVLLNERSISAFRTGYRELFGTQSAGDPLYEAVSNGQKFPGLDHWLPLFYSRLVSLLDYVPTSSIIFDPQAEDAMQAREKQVADFYQARLSLFNAASQSRKKGHNASESVAYKPVPMNRLYYTVPELTIQCETRPIGHLSPYAAPESGGIDTGGARGRDFADARTGASGQGDLYTALKTYTTEQIAQGRRAVIACYSRGSAERLAGLLRHHHIDVITDTQRWNEIKKLDPRIISLVILGLEHGFVSPDLVLMTEQDILGDRLIRKVRKKKAASQFQIELDSLSIGDFVVHTDHGIARYEGLVTIDALGAAHDCVRLIYDGGDKLFVPVENMDALSRYAGAESGAVLDKLGGAAWQARKARVKKRLLDIADGLLKIAAERHLKEGEEIHLDDGSYQEFSARFPYNETDDQNAAIESVLEDLAKGRPMDRLVCGDVGFGKTEVALRAAFAVAGAGLQVALVAPTTLLARQHYQNFIRRFSGFPIRIGQLSRMVTAKEGKETKDQLTKGQIDIVIGTHAVLAKDVKFANLGLVIVDEEQHFGVKQKEQLKELRTNVHVLTLTATPIPRTLQLALTGVRELSLITTPPVDRLAVSTYVLPYDPLIIREALMREHYRGGQSFYVCPRIEDLSGVAESLRELTPELKLITAHGRMSPGELDDIMTAFDGRKYDVLLATNIIESGLDIPNANTIILHRSDLFGLAQLYQLRGRVGRAKQRGYAYFTTNPATPLSSTAQQRLEVISTLDQLGAGFQLASHDMDIRGTGNLLGEEQSGHIREVGIELYQQMLEDAIAAAKAGGAGGLGINATARHTAERLTPQINIGIPVLIPESYVTDLNVRLGLYRRLADGIASEDIDSIATEIVDRFGPLPIEVENLLQTVAIKHLCRCAGIARLDAGAKGAVIGFFEDKFAAPDLLIQWITRQAGTVKVRPDQKLLVMRAWDDPVRRLDGVKTVIAELASLTKCDL